MPCRSISGIIDGCDLSRDRGLDFYLCVSELTFYPQPLLGEALAPSITDKKRYISSALCQPAAEIAAGAAGPEHQDLGPAHRIPLVPKVVRLTHPTLRRPQSLVAARDRSFQSLPCFCQFIRMCRFCGVFLPSVNSCSPTKLKRTMAAGPTTRIVGSLYSSEVHL